MGVVYVLTNPAMPGFVKIGQTTQSIEKRMRSLGGTNLPLPFECAAAWEFKDAPAVERALHDAFADRRADRLREFFTVEPERVVAILRQFGRRDVTPKRVDTVEEPEAAPRKRGPFRFSMVPEIEPGAVLRFAMDEGITCTVVGDNRVEFEGEEVTLSAAAKRVLRDKGRVVKAAQGPELWTWGTPSRTLNWWRGNSRKKR